MKQFLVIAFSISLLGGHALSQNTINHASRFAVSLPLSELAKLQPPPGESRGREETEHRALMPVPGSKGLIDPVEQKGLKPGITTLAVNSFLGIVHTGTFPPDTTMAVGDTQIVQWVNTSYTVCQKAAPYTCTAPIKGNMLWSSLGGLCAAYNDGDVVAQWDVANHRWLLAQNSYHSPYAACVAVSTTPDATGTYYLYQFPTAQGVVADYQKWGIWSTGYFQSYNSLNGACGIECGAACAYNAAKLRVGDKTAEQICHVFTSQDTGLLPGDVDSPTLPPSGQDEFFLGGLNPYYPTQLPVYTVHINNQSDWSKGATFSGDGWSQLLTIAAFVPTCSSNGTYGGDCVPQKGVGDKLDSFENLMYRLAYWNDGTTQHWLTLFDAQGSGGNTAPRWMEITAPDSPAPFSGLTVYQQGTYAPDTNWRWMGSIARDKNGDILLGYSESSSSMYPSIYVAGRQPSDPLGTLEQEVLVIAGGGSQIGTNGRWGDYSTMRIDPVDGCTFWYTQEYYTQTNSNYWSTQIASITFPSCSGIAPPSQLTATASGG
jgi:hypothetical protein